MKLKDKSISYENTQESNLVPPGSVIGILGGGQLGRMLTIEAKKMGYTVGILDPDENAPAAQVADFSLVADYSDPEALCALAERCDVITFEFENVQSAPLQAILGKGCQIHPNPSVLHIAQNREREKHFLQTADFPCAPFSVVSNAKELVAAAEQIGFPCVLKTADFGYDGKGQQRLLAGFDAEKVWLDFGCPRGVLEGWVDFVAELSVVCARWADGSMRSFPVVENRHRHHILDVSIIPARVSAEICQAATLLAEKITAQLEVVGLLTVELFLRQNGELVVNELAPRPHNSGHFSFDACVCSQFEQQLRAICGLPAGATELLRPVVMVNLLGDLWSEMAPPPWHTLLSDPFLKLHLYGKNAPRRGRKMGHFCTFGDTVEQAIERANEARHTLGLPTIE